jgi:hypothetical protein
VAAQVAVVVEDEVEERLAADDHDPVRSLAGHVRDPRSADPMPSDAAGMIAAWLSRHPRQTGNRSRA